MSGLVIGYDGSHCAHAALAVGLRIATRLDVPVVAFGYEVNALGGEVGDYAAALPRARRASARGRARAGPARAGSRWRPP